MRIDTKKRVQEMQLSEPGMDGEETVYGGQGEDLRFTKVAFYGLSGTQNHVPKRKQKEYI